MAQTWKPSKRFEAISGTSVSPAKAERIIASVLYNHDTVPDLVTLTCELVRSSRREMTFVEAAAILASEAKFDAEGWMK